MRLSMKKLSIIILLGLLLFQTNCLFTFFQVALKNTTYYKCLKSSINGRIILLYAYDKAEVDVENLQNVHNAIEAGLMIQPVIAPTRCWGIDEELQFLLGEFKGQIIERFWVLLGDTDDDCSWADYTPEENCRYLQEYIAKAAKLGMKMEIAAQVDDWIHAFKTQIQCPQISSSSLLWWLTGEDQQQYQQIGGWKTPYMQILTEAELCGQSIVVNKVISK